MLLPVGQRGSIAMNVYYPVMIVETYRMRIRRIKNMLPWNEYGFQVTNICSDAQKALAYYGEYLHKIVFVAINSFCEEDFCIIRQLRVLSKEVTIIGISKSEDYNTIRHAFKAGCNDVLLEKDVRYIYIKEILEEKKNSLDNNVTQGALTNNWKERMEIYLRLIRDNQYVDEKIVKDLLENESGLEILKAPYRLMLFRMDDVRKVNCAVYEYDMPKWRNSDEYIDLYQKRLACRDEMYSHLSLIIEDILKKYSDIQLLFPKKHSGLIILPNMDLEQALELAKCIQSRVYEELELDFSCAVTQSVTGTDCFLDLYRQLLELVLKKFYKGNRCLLILEDEQPFIRENNYKINSMREKLFQAYEKNDIEKFILDMEQLLTIMEKDNLHPDEVKKILCNLIDDTERWMHKKEIALDYPFDILKKGILESESIFSLKKEIEKIAKSIFQKISERNMQRTSKKVSAMVNYIQENLVEKLTLREIADCVELSEIHTSRLFKKEMGVHLTEYINTIRMEKAKELLISTNMKIKDVAMEVGITDQLYFSKVFKKHTGFSPREYKKDNRVI